MDMRTKADDRLPVATPTGPDAEAPVGAVAAHLVELAAGLEGGLLHLAADERAAETLAGLARAMAPELEVLLFPPWDCLPYDHASPSAAAQGGRLAALLAIAKTPGKTRLVIASPEALIQRSLPADALAGLELEVATGKDGEVERILRFAQRTGYRRQETADEPGEIALKGEVLDIFPAAAPSPVRLEIENGRVVKLCGYDPLTQLTTGPVDKLRLTPASELIAPEGEADPAIFPRTGPRPVGVEHELPRLCGMVLDGLLDHLPGAVLSLADGAEDRLDAALDQVGAAFATACAVAEDAGRAPPPRPGALYLDREILDAALSKLKRAEPGPQALPTPLYALAAQPLRDAGRHVAEVLEGGGVAVLTGAPADLKRLAHELESRSGRACHSVKTWREVLGAQAGSLLCMPLDLAGGFERDGGGGPSPLLVLTAQDVLGARAHHATHLTAATLLQSDPELRFGDLVIHQDHGVACLKGLERVEVAGQPRPAARLCYRDGAALLVPVEELGKVWRYGADDDAVSLDRLNTQGWLKKRAEVEGAIAKTAEGLAALAAERDRTPAPRIRPPRQAYERFSAGFAHPLTVDQQAALDAVMADLASGRPMNRLVCGDVGFGKTEVALRAAAAVALSGRQVAVVAPTTVLARQHLESFARRFRDFGLEVGQLSRLAKGRDAKATKAALASGELRMVVGTHALAAKDVAFHDLGLLIIDEEQRFGAGLKGRLHALAPAAHVLTLTATPIPRTLQGALVGIQAISVIATPPARRRPVRTLLAPFDPAAVKTALEREKARGGQSFVVTPRIEDLEPLRAQLADLVPMLDIRIAHGELAAEAVEEVMVGFGQGRGDVLLATNIIETGLDVPRANTMLIHHPDRFGLAQLHQLRGRVGRGRVQASCYLLHDPTHPLSEEARERLETLTALDRLGAGLAISARDLDLRGAGDLVGEDQAGHLRLIGIGLYQWLLARAVREAKGETVDTRPEPELALDAVGELPESYVPDPQARLNLYARLARLETAEEVRRFAHELEDRFGPAPAAATRLLSLARICRLAHGLGVRKLSAGPKAVALDLFEERDAERLAGRAADLARKGARLVWSGPPAEPTERLQALEHLLEALGEPDAPTASAPKPAQKAGRRVARASSR